MIAPKLHFLADIADRMEQLNQHDEHDQSSNEENTNDDHQQLLFKYLAESLHKQQQQMQIQMQQQQQQQSLPLDFSNNIKKEQHQQHSDEEDDDEETDIHDKSPRSMATAAATLPLIPPLLLRNKHGKPTRPFKAYPRDPLSLPLGFYSPLVPSSDNLLNVLASTTSGNNNNNNVNLPTNDEFSKQFRKRIQQAQERLLNRFQDSPMKNVHSPTSQEKIHSPSSTSTIPPKKRYRPNTPPPEISSSISTHQTTHQENDTKDEAYWERRRKNNEAAKRSRDARRAKEDEIALRAAWLEQENLKLRLENAHLKQENVQLRLQIYGSADLPTPTSQS